MELFGGASELRMDRIDAEMGRSVMDMEHMRDDIVLIKMYVSASIRLELCFYNWIIIICNLTKITQILLD